MMLKAKYLVFFSLLLFSSITQSVANTNDRVKGVSEFLMGRFQENYFYIFELRLKENELFKQYFPVTYGYAASGDLKYLLRANNGIWEESIEADIKKLATKYMVQFFYSGLLNALLKEEWVSEHISKIREMESLLIVVDNGVTTELGNVLSGNIKYTGSNIEVEKVAKIYRSYANAMQCNAQAATGRDC